MKGIVLIVLGICTVTDLRRQIIWTPLVCLTLAGSVLYHLLAADCTVPDIVFGMIPGVLMLILGWLTKEAIGYGDGLLVTACGAALGAAEVFALLLLGMFFSALWAVGMLLLHRLNRKDSFPFVPFLLAGWCSLLCLR